MFPYIRLYKPFRHYALGCLYIALIGFHLTQLLTPKATSVHADDPQLANMLAHENLLQQKAEQVLQRFDSSDHTVDLSVSLDNSTQTVTTFDPGHDIRACIRRGHDPLVCRNREESWQKSVESSPRVRQIRMCVTLSKADGINQDALYRSLSYSLGIDLSRGDVLRLVFI